jgi:hypothetical protein
VKLAFVSDMMRVLRRGGEAIGMPGEEDRERGGGLLERECVEEVGEEDRGESSEGCEKNCVVSALLGISNPSKVADEVCEKNMPFRRVLYCL